VWWDSDAFDKKVIDFAANLEYLCLMNKVSKEAKLKAQRRRLAKLRKEKAKRRNLVTFEGFADR